MKKEPQLKKTLTYVPGHIDFQSQVSQSTEKHNKCVCVCTCAHVHPETHTFMFLNTGAVKSEMINASCNLHSVVCPNTNAVFLAEYSYYLQSPQMLGSMS